ncbi:hypothetical protein WJX73_000292 [Symbiochloris irregularis]|uniref:Purple acid phosphatase n=1 Tax=Symbiochloris irregularis TaxID=706552 RepID=A0AAW1P2S1_9CHLO
MLTLVGSASRELDFCETAGLFLTLCNCTPDLGHLTLKGYRLRTGASDQQVLIAVTVLSVKAATNVIENISIQYDQDLGLDPSSPLPIDSPLLARNVTGLDPEQIHLTYFSAESVAVSWVTGEGVTSLKAVPLATQQQGGIASDVYFGTNSENLTESATGYTTAYQQIYTKLNATVVPLNYSSPLIHHTILTDLEPDTVYYYRVGDPKFGLSQVYSFRTAPTPGTGYPLRIGVVADVGQTINSSQTISHLAGNDPNYVILVGDLTYADDSTPNGTATHSNGTKATYPPSPNGSFQPRWDAWYRMMQPLLSRALFIPNNGNHELEPQGNASYYAGLHPTEEFPSGSQFQSYIHRQLTPYNQSNSPSPLYYSINLGPTHQIHLSNYVNFLEGSAQYEWLVEDLASFDRAATPWLIVTWHAPWYSSYTTHYKETECMRQAMEPLLYEAGADIIFNGHLHTYERTNPVYNYTVDECGIVNVVIGDGGNIEGLYKTFIDQPGDCPDPNMLPKYQPGPYCPSFTYPGGVKDGYCPKVGEQPEWSAFRQPAFGHGLFTVINETHAHWQWNRNYNGEADYADDVYIIRDLSCPNQASYPPPSAPATPVTAVAGK